jgi:hypothetical protein
VHGFEGAIFVGRAHGELVHVQLAQGNRARRSQTRGDRRLIRRHEAAQDFRPGRGFQAAGHEDVFEANGHAGKQARVSTRSDRGVDLVRAPSRSVGVDQQVTAQLAIEARDAVQIRLDQLAGLPFARAHAIGQFGDGSTHDLWRRHG